MTHSIVFVLISVFISALAFGIAFAASGSRISNYDIFIVLGVSFVIQWIAFIPAAIYNTEKFYDLTGSFTYLSCIILSFSLGVGDKMYPRNTILSVLVIIWALRLGTFLFTRIQKQGKDQRFDEIKQNVFRFFNVWTIQGLWVFLTALPVFTINASPYKKELNYVDFIGIVIWVFGFVVEVVSDYQKTIFAADPSNKGKWIDTGLWNYSRHPNYFGEITLWIGIFISCANVLTGARWIAVVSPVFVFVLIYFVSGVPKLEEYADKKWGNNADYQIYKQSTSILILRPKFSSQRLSEDYQRINDYPEIAK